jgi:hypothetical protein
MLIVIQFLRDLLLLNTGNASSKPVPESVASVATVQEKRTILPCVILDVSKAPEVSIKNSLGGHTVIDSVNILQADFKDKLSDWSNKYSISYPNQDDWVNFYTAWKTFIQ